MNNQDVVAVCSRSFSNNKILRDELLKKYKNVIFNDTGKQLADRELIDFLHGATKAIVALEKFTPEIINQLKTVRVLSKYGVGLDMIDLDALKISGIKLGWQGGVNKRSVAELTLFFMLALLRKSIQLNNLAKESGQWKQVIGQTLTEKKVGIIGCGNVGKDLVTLLKPFNCKIYSYDIVDYSDFYDKNNIVKTNLNELLETCEIVTIHTPLDSSTRHLINESNISLMADQSILINTARGGIVDEVALSKKLSENKGFMAGFDVLEIEPPEGPSELMNHANFICTPHIGGSTEDSVLKMGRSAIDSLDDHFLF